MRRSTRLRLAAVLAALAVSALGLTACGGSAAPAHTAASSAASHRAPARTLSTPPAPTTPAPTTPAPTTAPRSSASRSAAGPSTKAATSQARRHTAAPVRPASGAPVIVIDPGHSRTVSGTDPATGLNVADYENEPEMRDVFAVAQLVAAKLRSAGYRVVMTKTSVNQRRTLGERAQIANNAHASLALSIHDQAGSDGGIGFRSGNNIVYYQAVGDWRANPSGKRYYFTDQHVAALSKRYGQIFAAQRNEVQGVHVNLQSNTGYDLGSRNLPGGNIWLVQLLSKVPWIYNEAGGNSAGRSGLNSADKLTYANSLVAGVEHCVAPPR